MLKAKKRLQCHCENWCSKRAQKTFDLQNGVRNRRLCPIQFLQKWYQMNLMLLFSLHNKIHPSRLGFVLKTLFGSMNLNGSRRCRFHPVDGWRPWRSWKSSFKYCTRCETTENRKTEYKRCKPPLENSKNSEKKNLQNWWLQKDVLLSDFEICPFLKGGLAVFISVSKLLPRPKHETKTNHNY